MAIQLWEEWQVHEAKDDQGVVKAEGGIEPVWHGQAEHGRGLDGGKSSVEDHKL